MANKKITELPASTSVASTDLLVMVADPSGSPISKKITADNLGKNIPNVMGVVVHGADANVARPNNTVVTWIGSVEPVNAADNDIWEAP